MITEEQLSAYFGRIGLGKMQGLYDDDPRAFCTEENLKTIVFRHTLKIPFENLDMHNKLREGAPVAIDFPSVFKKIVSSNQNRGGYCFETTGLLKIVLTKLGFDLKSGIASVLWLKKEPAVRAHEYLIVTIGNREFLVDPGLGEPGPIEPLLLKENGQYYRELQLFPDREVSAFQIEEKENNFTLFAKIDYNWHPDLSFKPLYTSDPDEICDEENILKQNEMVSISQQSPFLERLIVTQPFLAKEGGIGRYSLSQTELKKWAPNTKTEIIARLSTQEDLMKILNHYFNIELPEGSDLTAKNVTFSRKIDSPSIDRLDILPCDQN